MKNIKTHHPMGGVLASPLSNPETAANRLTASNVNILAMKLKLRNQAR